MRPGGRAPGLVPSARGRLCSDACDLPDHLPDREEPLLTTPPFEPLLEVVARLEAEGIRCALGGSGLLAALGLVGTVGDWDLTADAPLERLLPIARDWPFETAGSSGVHADAKLMFPALSVEVIARFAFLGPAGVIHIPTLESGRWRGVPLGSPEAWLAAYHLLERPAKRDLLLGHLRTHGHDPGVVEALLAEPLPADLAGMLVSLRGPGHDCDGGEATSSLT